MCPRLLYKILRQAQNDEVVELKLTALGVQGPLVKSASQVSGADRHCADGVEQRKDVQRDARRRGPA